MDNLGWWNWEKSFDFRFYRRKKEEGRRKKEEGRRKKEEGRRKKEEGRRKKENAITCYQAMPGNTHREALPPILFREAEPLDMVSQALPGNQ